MANLGGDVFTGHLGFDAADCIIDQIRRRQAAGEYIVSAAERARRARGRSAQDDIDDEFYQNFWKCVDQITRTSPWSCSRMANVTAVKSGRSLGKTESLWGSINWKVEDLCTGRTPGKSTLYMGTPRSPIDSGDHRFKIRDMVV